MQIVILSRELASRRVDELVQLDAGGSGWNQASFMSELPEKWRWSRIALEGPSQAVIGLLIASRYAIGQVHTHELIVLPSARRLGVGRRLIEHLALDAAEVKEIEILSLKVAKENITALEFYNALSFNRGKEERGMFWMNRDSRNG